MSSQHIPVNFLQSLDRLVAALSDLNERVNFIPESDWLESVLPALALVMAEGHANMATALAGVSAEVYHEAKAAYREKLTPLICQAAIVERCVNAPRGYHGDYLTMEMMYRNGYEGTTPFGQCLHHLVTRDRCCSSVRARRTHLISQLRSEAVSGQKTVLSLACGPARELADIMAEQGGSFRKVVLLDQDQEAISFAAERLRPLLPGSCELVTLNLPVQSLLFRSDLEAVLGNPDYIYSAGLFDYLPTEFASRLVERLCKALPPDGRMEFGNFAEWPVAFFADMASGWQLILRDEVEMSHLIPVGRQYKLTRVEDQVFASISGGPL